MNQGCTAPPTEDMRPKPVHAISGTVQSLSTALQPMASYSEDVTAHDPAQLSFGLHSPRAVEELHSPEPNHCYGPFNIQSNCDQVQKAPPNFVQAVSGEAADRK